VAVGQGGEWQEVVEDRLDVVGDGVRDSVRGGGDEGVGAGWSLVTALTSRLGLEVCDIDALRGERVEEDSGGGRRGGVLSWDWPGCAVYLH
jgi:hypothetical protein